MSSCHCNLEPLRRWHTTIFTINTEFCVCSLSRFITSKPLSPTFFQKFISIEKSQVRDFITFLFNKLNVKETKSGPGVGWLSKKEGVGLLLILDIYVFPFLFTPHVSDMMGVIVFASSLCVCVRLSHSPG